MMVFEREEGIQNYTWESLYTFRVYENLVNSFLASECPFPQKTSKWPNFYTSNFFYLESWLNDPAQGMFFFFYDLMTGT